MDFLLPLTQVSERYQELPQAAVLVLVDEMQGLVMVEKAGHLRRHAGEIAFPGGKLEAGESHIECAMRECAEEVAIQPEQYQLLGRMLPKVTRHRIAVHPLVARLHAPAALKIDKNEIADAFYVPLTILQDPANYRQRQAEIEGERILLSYYQYQQHEIWGVTAQIIYDLLQETLL